MNIKKLRKKLNLTQKEFGEILGMDGKAVRRFEMPETANNHRKPTRTIHTHLELWQDFANGADMNDVFEGKVKTSKKAQ